MKYLLSILVSALSVLGQINLTISTDRIEYSTSDTIHITLEAMNNGSVAVQLPMGNECESAYFIGDWFSLDDTSLVCQTNYHNLLIASGNSVSWSWDYFIDDHPENIGRIALNGVLFFSSEPPFFSDLYFLQIGQVDPNQIVSGFMPSVDTLRIEGGCIMPELLLEPASLITDHQKLMFTDAWEGLSINLKPRPNWDNYMNTTYFWVSHDSMPFTFSATLESDWDTLDFPIGENHWLENGLFKVFIHHEGSIIDSISQLINVHITGAVSGTKTMNSNVIRAYPNPFNSNVNISFQIEETAHTRISLFNILGEEVYSTDLGLLNPADYTYEWLGVDNQGRSAKSGVYLIKIMSSQFTETKKIILLK